MSPKQELDKGTDAFQRFEMMKDQRMIPEEELALEEELDLLEFEKQMGKKRLSINSIFSCFPRYISRVTWVFNPVKSFFILDK